MNNGYRCAERKVLDSRFVRGTIEFSKGLYEGAATFFRFPTAVRKFYNRQGIPGQIECQWEDRSSSPSKVFGFGLGFFVAGVFADNCDPALAVAAATNALSASFELGRYRQSRLEYQEIKPIRAMEELRRKGSIPICLDDLKD